MRDFGFVNSYDGFNPTNKFRILPPDRASREATRGDAGTVQSSLKAKCKVFNMSIDDQRDEYEDLMSRMANGDPSVQYFGEQTSFSKEGEYLIALRWFEEKKV